MEPRPGEIYKTTQKYTDFMFKCFYLYFPKNQLCVFVDRKIRNSNVFYVFYFENQFVNFLNQKEIEKFLEKI